MTTKTRLHTEQQIVLHQLLAARPDLKLSVGQDNSQTYTRNDLIDHVEKLDTIGKEIIKTQMEFMRSFKTGEIYKFLSTAPVSPQD